MKSKLKNWLINKLGGYTFDEYEEMKDVMIKHYEEMKKIASASQAAVNEIYELKVEQPKIYTLRAEQIVPVIDGDWEFYIRQEIAKKLSDKLLEEKLIDWDVYNMDNAVRGTLYVMEPPWRPIVCDM